MCAGVELCVGYLFIQYCIDRDKNSARELTTAPWATVFFLHKSPSLLESRSLHHLEQRGEKSHFLLMWSLCSIVTQSSQGQTINNSASSLCPLSELPGPTEYVLDLFITSYLTCVRLGGKKKNTGADGDLLLTASLKASGRCSAGGRADLSVNDRRTKLFFFYIFFFYASSSEWVWLGLRCRYLMCGGFMNMAVVHNWVQNPKTEMAQRILFWLHVYIDIDIYVS